MKNQSEKEKYDYLQSQGREPEEGFYFKTRRVLEDDDGKVKYEKKINYIFNRYV